METTIPLMAEGIMHYNGEIVAEIDPDGANGPLPPFVDKVKFRVVPGPAPFRALGRDDGIGWVNAAEAGMDGGAGLLGSGAGLIGGGMNAGGAFDPVGFCLRIRFGQAPGADGVVGDGWLEIHKERPTQDIFLPSSMHYLSGLGICIELSGSRKVATLCMPDGDRIRYRFPNGETGKAMAVAKDHHRLYQLHLEREEGGGAYRLYTPAGSYLRFTDAGGTWKTARLVTAKGRSFDAATAGFWPSGPGGGSLTVANDNKSVSMLAPRDGQTGGTYRGYDIRIGKNGELHTVWRIENPSNDLTDCHRVRIVRYATTQYPFDDAPDKAAEVHECLFDSAEGAWKVTSGLGADARVIKTVQAADVAGTDPATPITATVTRTVANAQGAVVETVRKTVSFLHGEDHWLKKIVIDPDNASLTSEYKYAFPRTDIIEGVSLERKLLSETTTTGDQWAKMEYDADWRLTVKTGPWEDGKEDKTTYEYAAVNASDVPLFDNDVRPRTVTETIGGLTVAKVWFVYGKNANGDLVEITEQADADNTAFGNAGNLRTTDILWGDNSPNPLFCGMPKESQQSDGIITGFDYEMGSMNLLSGVFTPSAEGEYLRSTATFYRLANLGDTTPQPLSPGKSQRLRMILDKNNKVVREEIEIFKGAAEWELVGWTSYTYDGDNRLTKINNSDGTSESLVLDIYGLELGDTQPDGTQTSTAYNQHLEPTVENCNGRKTEWTRNAAGAPVQIQLSAGNKTLTAIYGYDGAARPVSSIGFDGVAATCIYNAAQRMATVTGPDGGTISTTSHVDGGVKSISGTGMVPSFSKSEVNPDGSICTVTCTGTATEDYTFPWEKKTVDRFGRIKKIERPACGTGTNSEEFFYDGFGRLCKKKLTPAVVVDVNPLDGDDGVPPDTLIEYDAAGLVWRTGADVDKDGQLTPASKDRFTESETCIVGNVRETIFRTYATDNDGTPTQTGSRREWLNNRPNGESSHVEETDIHGNVTVTTVKYMGNGMVEHRINVPDSDADIVQVYKEGRLASRSDKDGTTSTITYDALGRQVAVTDARGNATTFAYNEKSQVVSSTDAAGHATVFAYDPVTGRMTGATNPLGGTSFYGYDLRGNVVRTWGSAVKPSEVEFDSANRRTKLKTYRGGTGWNGPTWPGGGTADTTTWDYDSRTGAVTKKTDAEGHFLSYSYTALGMLAERRSARLGLNGQRAISRYGYNAFGKLIEVKYDDGTPNVAYAYDRLGRATQVTDAAGTRAFSYNDKLQLDAEAISGNLYTKTIGRSYYERQENHQDDHLVGRLKSTAIAADSYSVGYGYDAMGRFNRISGSGGTWNFSYLAGTNLLEQVTGPAGISITGTYEANRDLLTRRENKIGGGAVSAFEHTNDALGRRTTVARSGTAFAQAETLTFGYNDCSELVSATSSLVQDNDWRHLFAYDNIGNRLTATKGQANPLTTTYLTSPANAYTSIQEGNQPEVVPTYDIDGNMLNLPGGAIQWDYQWDGENRLVKATGSNGAIVECQYDYLGRRVEKIVTVNNVVTKKFRFVYDGFSLIQELDGLNNNAIVRSYVWRGDLLAAVKDHATGSSYYYLHDTNKNVSELVDSNGNIVAHYEYGPFGGLSKSTGAYAQANPFRFSNEYWDDDLGLIYYNYRYYSTSLGRWLSRDPLEEQGGMNLYAFAFNNGVNCFDLLGCEGYWHDVGQVFRGYGDAVVGTAEGIGFVARHPIQAVQGIGTAVVHYEDTYKAIKDEVIEKSGTCRGQGELLGTVLITVATSGGAGAGAKATGMAGKIAQSTTRAAKALKAGVIGEDVTNAARVAKVITKAEATAGVTSKVGAGAAEAESLAIKVAPKSVAGKLSNKARGILREERLRGKLKGRFGADNVLRERTLLDSAGKKVIDPITKKGRRIDFIVLDDAGNARFSIESTSRNQVRIGGKANQIFKETTIRSRGGTYIRHPVTGELIDVSGVNTRVIGLEPLR